MAVGQNAQPGDVPAACGSCDARRRGLCSAFNGGQLAELAEASSKREVPAGTELSDYDSYSNILSGVVKLTKSLSDGRQQIVGFHFAPDFLGRPFQARRPARAEAATDLILCSFPMASVQRFIETSPELSSRLLRHALQELDEARDWMAALGRKTASEKIASFLVMVARNVELVPDATRALSFDLPLTRVEVADFLGLTFETVSRELSRLRADDVIGITNKRRIRLGSLVLLENLCGD